MGRVFSNRRKRSVPRLRHRWVAVVLVLVYAVAATVVTAYSVIGGLVIDDLAGPIYLAFNIVAFVLSVRAARHRNLDARSRRGWWIIAASLAVVIVSSVMFGIASEELDASEYPLAADWVRLAWAPIMLVGLLTMPTRSKTLESRTKTLLDVGMVVVGGAMLMWHLVIGPVLVGQDQRVSVTVAALAYPLFDLALIGAATIVQFRTASSSARRPVVLLGVAVGVMVTGDIYLGYQRVRSDTENFGWQFLVWIGACLLMALAALEQHRLATDHRLDTDTDPALRPVPRLPYAAVTLGYGLLITVATGLPIYPYGGLVIGAVGMTGLVVARQITALRENYHLVVTDNLTGLANRALLRDRLARAVERARGTGRPVAVIQIDLNRFKEINDTLGHEAGDEMLVAFAGILRRSVRRQDIVARLGGDEFVIVLEGEGAAAAATAMSERIKETMKEPVTVAGRPMYPSASIGIAVSGRDGDSPGELLHQADTAMYRAKRADAGTRPDADRGHAAAEQVVVDHGR